MSRFVVARQARQDLDDLWDYVARDNPAAADRLVDKIRERFKLLASNPLLGPIRPELGDGIRQSVVDRYVLFYRALQDHVRIVRVIHSARDIPSAFGQDPSDA